MLGWQGNCHGNAEAAQAAIDEQQKLKEEARAKKYQTERERCLKRRLAEVEQLLNIQGDESKFGSGRRTSQNWMEGGHSKANLSHKQGVDLEAELLQLRKDITVERQKAVSAMRAVKGTAQDSLDVASWTQKVLNKDAMFDLDKGDKCEAQFVHNTSGLCSREDFTKKRKEIKGKESQKKEKRTKKAKKAASMLSFDVQEDE